MKINNIKKHNYNTKQAPQKTHTLSSTYANSQNTLLLCCSGKKLRSIARHINSY